MQDVLLAGHGNNPLHESLVQELVELIGPGAVSVFWPNSFNVSLRHSRCVLPRVLFMRVRSICVIMSEALELVENPGDNFPVRDIRMKAYPVTKRFWVATDFKAVRTNKRVHLLLKGPWTDSSGLQWWSDGTHGPLPASSQGMTKTGGHSCRIGCC